MKERFDRFMYGRYGSDQLSKLLLGVCFACLILNIFTGSRLLYLIAVVMLVFAYIRIFSKDHTRRYAENMKYLQIRDRILKKLGLTEKQIQQRKMYHIYHCPGCSQKIRIPRGKGRIEITCPKCGNKFTKNS